MYLYNNVSSSLFHNPVFIQTHCNDRRNTFHLECCQWYKYQKFNKISYKFILENGNLLL